jgi:hypothetical protein
MTINSLDDCVAGSLLIFASTIAIVYYLFVLRAIFRVSKVYPTFLIFFSQGIGEVGLLLNLMWLGIDILIGPSIMFHHSKIYSIVQNLATRPTLYYYLLVALTRLCAVRFPTFFRLHATKRLTICACVFVWFVMWCEVIILHILPYPVDAYINHNIELYAITSLNLTVYFSTPLPTYFNVHNIFIGVTTFLCYFISMIVLRSLTGSRKSHEGRLIIYSLLDNFILFTPTVMRAIITNSSKWTLFGIHMFRAFIYCSGAILLPIFSEELRATLFKNIDTRVHPTAAKAHQLQPQVSSQTQSSRPVVDNVNMQS